MALDPGVCLGNGGIHVDQRVCDPIKYSDFTSKCATFPQKHRSLKTSQSHTFWYRDRQLKYSR